LDFGLYRRIVDLSHPINDRSPGWPGDAKSFEVQDCARPERDGYFTRSFWMLEHYGTHLDAPIHFAPGNAPVDRIAPERLLGPAAVIDIRPEAGENPDYQLAPAKVEQWEKVHGRIAEGSIALLRTGWAARWPDVARYWNMDDRGVLHSPGFSVEAAQMLVERGVSGLGIDAISVDPGSSTEHRVHKLSHSAGLYHLENLADLSGLPESGALLVVAPLKLEGGSGAPCRVFALLP
jgi:kynurenine formamidase